MSTKLTVPELGENIDTATVVEVFVKSGDHVDKDQAVLSLETDKAQFELPATDAGTVDEVLVSVGDDVSVGQAVLSLSAGEGAAKDDEDEAKPAKARATSDGEEKAAKARTRQDQDGGTDAEAGDGDAEAESDAGADDATDGDGGDAETGGAAVDDDGGDAETAETAGDDDGGDAETAETAGDDDGGDTEASPARGAKSDAQRKGERATGDTTSAKGAGEQRPSAPAKRPPSKSDAAPAEDAPKKGAAPKRDGAASRPKGAPIAAAPSVRRLARELGASLDDVAAETDDGRVTAADVKAFKERGAKKPAAAAKPAAPSTPGWPAPEPLPDFSKWGEIEIQEMSKIRRKTAENMARAWVEIPTVTHHDEADITSLEALRKRFAPRVKESGGSLTWTAILLHVLAGALRRFPQFNASVDMAESRIVYKKYVHIGVAVDTERGLLVPVIRDVDEKNIAQLAKALSEVSEAARSRNIKPDMMQGATFTITNLGGIGGVGFNPIVNPPQVAILGVSRGSTRPIWRDGKFEPRQILPLALSYDHRVIDGADAARFLRWTCEALEEPFLLDLEGQ